MLHYKHLLLCAASALVLVASHVAVADEPSHDAFTYQGLLTQGGNPVSGPVNLTFRLYNAASGGDLVGPELSAPGFNDFDEGRFTIDLAFGKEVFDGTPLWLEIQVGTTVLAPRQPVMPTPYAVRALTIAPTAAPFLYSGTDAIFTSGNVGIGTSAPQARLHVSSAAGLAVMMPGLRLFEHATSPNVAGGYAANEIGAGVFGATIAGGGNAANINRVTGNYGVIGGGRGNTAMALATVGGGSSNTAGALDATIGGGESNVASGIAATIGGGYINTADGLYGTIGGGLDNSASIDGATVGGGIGNTADGIYATVGGGDINTASGNNSTVSGGLSNTAEGHYATISGGRSNAADGDYSFAAGRRAKAMNNGTFVWGDSTDLDFASTASNQFLIRASGNVGINTNSPSVLLALGDPGTGLHRPAADTLALHAGAAERLRINSLGNVGIGAAPSNARLRVQGAADVGEVWVHPLNSSGNGDLRLTENATGSFGMVIRHDGVSNLTEFIGIQNSAENATPTMTINRTTTGGVTVTNNLSVGGTLTKGGGSFKIDHPLDPENKYLYHSFVESPDMMNIYNGVVFTDDAGYATVTLPEWFEALNRDFRYQLTVIDEGDGEEFVMAKVVRKIDGNAFRIRTSHPDVEVSWQVTGVRHDAYAESHRIPVEEEKGAAEKGRYLHPEEFGASADRVIAAVD